MPTLNELAARCETEEPSQTLDAEIVVAADLRPPLWRGAGPLWIDLGTAAYGPIIRVNNLAPERNHSGNPPMGDYPKLTSSRDAAAELIPGGCTEIHYVDDRRHWCANVYRPGGGFTMGRAPSEIMARCAAYLRARAHPQIGPDPWHRYIPMRGVAGSATLPPGISWTYVESPARDGLIIPDLPISTHRYGIIETNRALTAIETVRFALKPAP